MALSGYLDYADSNGVKGWAFDSSNPSENLEVEILVDGHVCESAVCNHFRADLLTHNIGNGKHAFFHDFSTGPLYGDGKAIVEARIKNTDFVLPGSPLEVEKAFYKYVAVDLVDNCNLRCPFCLYDYSNTKKSHYLSEHNFKKITQLLPYVPRGEFWMSCLHEPSLHPNFLEYIEFIPEEFRKKVFFTSNFARKLDDEFFDVLANSNIHHINISVDSLNESLYSKLRKGSRLNNLLLNLEKLTDAFSKNDRSPLVRFITMVFKTNFDELPHIIKECSDKFNAVEHEVRYPYKLPHITDEFKNEHFLEHHRWAEVESLVKSLPYRILFDPPKPEYEKSVPAPIEYYLNRDPYNPVLKPEYPKKPYGLRFSCNGDVRIEDMEEHFLLNAAIVENLHPVFRSL